MGEEDEQLTASAADLGLPVAVQVAAARRGEDGAKLPIQVPSLGCQRRGGQVGDALGQGEHGVQPMPQTPGDGIVAGLDDVGHVTGEMGEAGRVFDGVSLLGGVAVQDPYRRPVAVHHRPHQYGPRAGEAVCTTARAERKTE